MLKLVIGSKGKGKTKIILEQANTAVKDSNGSIVYLDKSSKHMYELNNKIRLIDVSRFPLRNSDEFIGFICGIISQDHDLDQIFLDGFLKIASIPEENNEALEACVMELQKLSELFGVSIIISLSRDSDELPEVLRQFVTVSL